MTVADIGKWIDKTLDGEGEIILRSEPIPALNLTSNVTEIVG